MIRDRLTQRRLTRWLADRARRQRPRSPGWHVHGGGWPLGRRADDLTPEEIHDVFTDPREGGR